MGKSDIVNRQSLVVITQSIVVNRQLLVVTRQSLVISTAERNLLLCRRPENTPMLKVGLTGGIASGKSVVGEMMAALGAHVIQADQIAHQLLQPGESVYREVVQHFGAGILNPDGTVNRGRLAQAAFEVADGGSSRIQELNEIVHPAVLLKQEQWMNDIGRQDPSAIAIVEAALILESGAARQFDRLVVVSCLPEQRIRRWADRVKVDEETARAEVMRRMAAQRPDAEKLKAADYVIDNTGSLDATQAQVKALFVELQKQSTN